MADEFLGERRTYAKGGLERADLADDPIEQFRSWLADATRAGVPEPSAMGLSTVGSDGRPSSRMVLLRSVDYGFVFFTNYGSRKGRDLLMQPHASLLFWWAVMERQVRVEGLVVRTSEEESDAYFSGRPRESQLASAASPQSEEVGSREGLELVADELDRVSTEAIARPPHWGGYRLIPDRFEFWQGRPARLHDRFIYVLNPLSGDRRRGNGGERWQIARLAP